MLTNTLHFEHSVDPVAYNNLLVSLKIEMESDEVGYYHLMDAEESLLSEIATYAKEPWYRDTLDTIVVIGIGGSSLGTKAVCEMAGVSKSGKRMVYLENVDPVNIENQLNTVNLLTSLFLVVSKSGTTIETISIAKYVFAYFGLLEDPGRFRHHVCVITDAGSPLEQFAEEHQLKVFHIPKNVGGRFSVLSAVGLVPLYLYGLDVDALLEGASEMRKRLFDHSDSTLLQKAIYYNDARSTYPLNVLFCYGSGFDAFNRWYVQLWAESLGKVGHNGERVGLTPIGLTGAVDQHSFLQLIMEGPRNKTVTFVKVGAFESNLRIPEVSLRHLERTDYVNGRTFEALINAECDATMQSVIAEGIPVDVIEIDRLDAFHIGGLLFYFELLTSMVGILEGVNTYDHPGVEHGKRILRESLGSNDG